MAHPKVVIVMAKCTLSMRDFGIRFEEKSSGQWVGDWAFDIKAEAARREGYDSNLITGTFEMAVTYPGCPSCEVGGIAQCSCNQVSCWDLKQTTHKCPGCGVKSKISGSIQNLNAGGDR
jgi:hypothetical protein